MRPIASFTVTPSLPKPLECLEELAYNLYWVWNHEALDLFRRLDRQLWDATGHNPVRMLGIISQERLESRVHDDGFMAYLERVYERYRNYMEERGWYEKTYGQSDKPHIAYFSLEFGLTECVPIYSGGLGLLAGDHMKSASDLGLPLVGVGLLYQQGYFRQYLNIDGWQQERNPENDFYTMPVRQVLAQDGTPLKISVDYPSGPVHAQVWRTQVGRVPLYLLDSNISDNAREEDRDITDQLYGGDPHNTRIRQEILLGIGGFRALEALGIDPTVCHMNEGHSAFLALERIRMLMKRQNLTFAQAREATRVGNVFTTHTPVPAGNDVFPPDLIDRYFAKLYPELGLTRNEFMGLGRERPEDQNEGFCMTVLALRLSTHRNGVSQLHGSVSRRMWQNVWPGVPREEIPITSITNGVHIRSWISHDMADLFDRYLGPRWRENPADQSIWERVSETPAEELWRTHERRRERLVAFARRRLRLQLEQRGATPKEIEGADEALDPEALTLGFARRFATYKRAELLLRNPERLVKILTNKEHPVQIIFAGKAHPKDNPGKDIIRRIIHFARREDVRRHVVFLEDYDIEMARYLVQGVDVWVNTPRRPLEASGTSGMKATVNGGVNISILDGWWDEAYRDNPDVGWAIGRGEEYDDPNYQDDVESNALYDILEKEVIPIFYERSRDSLPRGWIAQMKSSMRHACPVYNTNRMVREYSEFCYIPADRRFREMTSNNSQRALRIAAWGGHLRQEWSKIRFLAIQTDGGQGKYKVGDTIESRVKLFLGNLSVDEVQVQVYFGPLDAHGIISHGTAMPMRPLNGDTHDGTHEYSATIPCEGSGRYGYSVRVLPHHDDLSSPYEPGFILWA